MLRGIPGKCGRRAMVVSFKRCWLICVVTAYRLLLIGNEKGRDSLVTAAPLKAPRVIQGVSGV